MKITTLILVISISTAAAILPGCGDDNNSTIVTPKPDPTEDPDDEPKLPAPPKTWQEHWFEHNQLLNLVYYDDDVAIYYDDRVSRSVKWTFKYIGDVWRYTKEKYGAYGDDPRLYAVFHTNIYTGGHPGYYFDGAHDNRNVIDCAPYEWLTLENGGIDQPTHEVFHIVESASFNTKGSPGFGTPPNGIWGDSKFAEIYQYDVYLGLGLEAEAKRWSEAVMEQYNNNPRPLTYWFRDWFYPIYQNHGKTKVLVEYFRLVAKYFPKNTDKRFTRSMNWGEFVHFFSGAAGTDLKAQAQKAFGWTTEMDLQLYQAKIDFEDITY